MLGPCLAFLRVAAEMDEILVRWDREILSRILAIEYPNRWAILRQHCGIQFVSELEITKCVPPVVVAQKPRHFRGVTVHER